MRDKTSDHRVKRPNALFAALVIGSSLSITNPGFAEEEVIEEQVVTGSRLQTTNETASQPIATISEQALSKSGQFDIGEVLNDSPSLLTSVTGTNSLDASAANIGQTQNFGGAALDLRGMGFKRTLTLVKASPRAGIEGTAAVDISTIPAALSTALMFSREALQRLWCRCVDWCC